MTNETRLARDLQRAVLRAEDGAGTLPAKEAVKLVPADWHRVCDLSRKAALALSAAPSPPAGGGDEMRRSFERAFREHAPSKLKSWHVYLADVAMKALEATPPAGGGEPVARDLMAAAIANMALDAFAKWKDEANDHPNCYQSEVDRVYRYADRALSALAAPPSPDAAQQRIRELEEIRDAYEKWRKERGGMGMSCFVSSADQQAAFARADNALAMAVARILHQGTPRARTVLGGGHE